MDLILAAIGIICLKLWSMLSCGTEFIYLLSLANKTNTKNNNTKLLQSKTQGDTMASK